MFRLFCIIVLWNMLAAQADRDLMCGILPLWWFVEFGIYVWHEMKRWGDMFEESMRRR